MTFLSCVTEEIDKETRIEMAIEEKVQEFRKTELLKCINDLKRFAEMEVDSVLRIMAKQQKIDTISPPSRFTRPKQPNLNFRKFEKPTPIQVDSIN